RRPPERTDGGGRMTRVQAVQGRSGARRRPLLWPAAASRPPPARRVAQSTARKISDALVPPKPNEVDSTVVISRFRALCGTRSIAVSTDGLSRLMVGGAVSSRMASTEKIASTAPAAPSRWPIDDLVDDIAIRPDALPTMR